MREADQRMERYWSILKDVDERAETVKFRILDDVNVVTGWGLPLQDGAVAVPGTRDFGWSSADHVDRAFSILSDGHLNEVADGGGPVALLSFPGAYTFGHWLTDVLPRIELLASEYDIKDLKFIVPGPLTQWMLDLLKIFEIREEDLIPLSEKDRFRAHKLIVPSLCRNYDYLPLFPHKKLMLRVKNWGAGRIDRDKLAKTKLLVKHLPMTSATWRSSLGNFDQLREKLEPLGFITVCPGEMSIDAQVTAFAGAQMIVGEDSSALHNIIYTDNAQLIVVTSENRKNLLHLSISKLLGHRCNYIFYKEEEKSFYCDVSEVAQLVSSTCGIPALRNGSANPMPNKSEAGEKIDYAKFLGVMKQILRPSTYLEVGVGSGTTLFSDPLPSFIVGIDPSANFGSDIEVRLGNTRHTLIINSTSDDGFAELCSEKLLGGRQVDMAFVDGLHHSEVVIRDIANAAKLCREDALIFVHNVFPENELQGSREQPQGNVASMDDVYKVVPIFWRFFNSMPTILLKDVSPSGMFVLRVTGDAYGEIMEPYDEILFALDELEFTPTLAEMHEKAVSSSSREMEAFMEKAIASRTAKVLQVI